jgi:uncharacterized protein
MNVVSMIQVRADGVARVPWRNGGGRTRELLTWPAHAEWLLRISLADIDADGPFSTFPGVTRWFAVVAGAGVRLRIGARTLTLTVDDAPLQFDGAAAPECVLIDGPTQDLNLMVRGGDATMRRTVPDTEWTEAFDERGLFTLSAGTLITDSGPVALAPLTLAWQIGPGACRFAPSSPGRAGFWLGWSAPASRGRS